MTYNLKILLANSKQEVLEAIHSDRASQTLENLFLTLKENKNFNGLKITVSELLNFKSETKT